MSPQDLQWCLLDNSWNLQSHTGHCLVSLSGTLNGSVLAAMSCSSSQPRNVSVGAYLAGWGSLARLGLLLDPLPDEEIEGALVVVMPPPPPPDNLRIDSELLGEMNPRPSLLCSVCGEVLLLVWYALTLLGTIAALEPSVSSNTAWPATSEPSPVYTVAIGVELSGRTA